MQNLKLKQIAEIRSKIQQFITLPKSKQAKSSDRALTASRKNSSPHSKSKLKQSKKMKSSYNIKIVHYRNKDRNNKQKNNQIQVSPKGVRLKDLNQMWRTKDSYLYECMNSQQVVLVKRQQPEQTKLQQVHQKAQSDIFSFDQTHQMIRQIYKVVPKVLPQSFNSRKSQANFVVQSHQQTVRPSSLFKKQNFINPNYISKTNNIMRQVSQNKQAEKGQNQNNHVDRTLRQSMSSLLKNNIDKSQENRNKSLSLSQIQDRQRDRKAKKEKELGQTFSRNRQSEKRLSDSQYQGSLKVKPIRNNYKSPVVSPNRLKHQNSLSPQERLKYKTSRQTNYLIKKFSSKPIQKQNYKSPNDKHENLSKKYDNLDKRLSNLLQRVRQQKKVQTPSTQYLQNRPEISQEVLIYKKFSPLKKLLKVNKDLRLKFQESQKDRLFFQ